MVNPKQCYNDECPALSHEQIAYHRLINSEKVWVGRQFKDHSVPMPLSWMGRPTLD